MAIVSRHAHQMTAAVSRWCRQLLRAQSPGADSYRVQARLIVLAIVTTAGVLVDGVTLRGQTVGTFTWSHNGEKFEVTCRGEVEFGDDDLSVRKLTPQGVLQIKERRRASARAIDFNADTAGNMTGRFFVGTYEKPLDTEGREWLARILPHLIRHTGIGASGRVARFLRTNGASGVLAEISLIEGSWAKRLYFAELLNTPGLDPVAIQQSLAQAAREMSSEPELAGLLAVNPASLKDERTRQAYLDAARTIDGDFEVRQLFSTILEGEPIDGAALAGILQVSTSIGSASELASLLVQLAKLRPLDNATRPPFFKALDTLVASHAEHGRVLAAVLEQPQRSPETAAAVLRSASNLGGDNEALRLLELIANEHSIDGSLRAPFFGRVASISSPHERSRVLQIVARRKDVPEATILDIFSAAKSMTASFEAAQVLVAVAETHTLSGAVRAALIDATKNLGEFDRGRVIRALEVHERRGSA